MKSLIPFLALIIFLSFSGCHQSSGNKTNKNKSEKIAEVYTCPMHPEVESDKPGECPKCGMELVIKDEGSNHPDSSANVDDEIK